jgi:hypothetical protein
LKKRWGGNDVDPGDGLFYRRAPAKKLAGARRTCTNKIKVSYSSLNRRRKKGNIFRKRERKK